MHQVVGVALSLANTTSAFGVRQRIACAGGATHDIAADGADRRRRSTRTAKIALAVRCQSVGGADEPVPSRAGTRR